jgi:hypothetical protein
MMALALAQAAMRAALVAKALAPLEIPYIWEEPQGAPAPEAAAAAAAAMAVQALFLAELDRIAAAAPPDMVVAGGAVEAPAAANAS